MSISFYGDRLAISFQKTLHIFNVEDGKHTKIEMKSTILDADLSGAYAFIATSDKKVSSYTLAGAKMTERGLAKKPTRVCRISDDHFVVSDRFGDLLYLQIQVNEAEQTSSFKKTSAAGHLALISDMVYSNGFLISSDREESIWVTRFPKTWVIENFCFGHRRFVSKVCLFGEDTLISGGGDGHLCVFNWRKGKLQSKLKIIEGDPPKTFSVTNIVQCGAQILVTTNQKVEILVLELDTQSGNSVNLVCDRTVALECKEITTVHYLEKQGVLLVLDREGKLTTLTPNLTPLSNDFTKLLTDTLQSSLPDNIVFQPLYEVFPRHIQSRDKNIKPKKRKGEHIDAKEPKKQKTEQPKQPTS